MSSAFTGAIAWGHATSSIRARGKMMQHLHKFLFNQINEPLEEFAEQALSNNIIFKTPIMALLIIYLYHKICELGIHDFW
jgi:hypothetical protein